MKIKNITKFLKLLKFKGGTIGGDRIYYKHKQFINILTNVTTLINCKIFAMLRMTFKFCFQFFSIISKGGSHHVNSIHFA